MEDCSHCLSSATVGCSPSTRNAFVSVPLVMFAWQMNCYEHVDTDVADARDSEWISLDRRVGIANTGDHSNRIDER